MLGVRLQNASGGLAKALDMIDAPALSSARSAAWTAALAQQLDQSANKLHNPRRDGEIDHPHYREHLDDQRLVHEVILEVDAQAAQRVRLPQ